MANNNTPFGFAQRSGTGSSPTYEQVTGTIASNTAAIYFGDPIFRLSADGTLAGVTTGPGPGTTPIAGVFVGCTYNSVAAQKVIWLRYWPGNTSDVASGSVVTGYYINDPNAQFLAQVAGSTTTGAVTANIGLNVQFAYGTGNASNGNSGAYVDINTAPATTAGFPFRLVKLVTSPPGSPGTAAGAYNWVVVAFNNVETKALTAV